LRAEVCIELRVDDDRDSRAQLCVGERREDRGDRATPPVADRAAQRAIDRVRVEVRRAETTRELTGEGRARCGIAGRDDEHDLVLDRIEPFAIVRAVSAHRDGRYEHDAGPGSRAGCTLVTSREPRAAFRDPSRT
jgi:hypothetical protein